MKTLQFIQSISLSCLLVIGAASCNSGENSQPYTPLQVYFEPIRMDMNVEHLMPYFVNYPSDWAKMGLRNYPKLITYEYHDAAWGVTSSSQYEFLPNGRLAEQRRTSFNVGATGFDVISYEYDNHSNLIQIKSVDDGRYKRRKKDDGFTYNSIGRLIRRDKNGRGHYDTATFLYAYHANGALQSILPENKNGTVNEAGVTIHKMQFDSLAHLESFETPNTSNMFLKGINSYKLGQSVTSYAYAGHLCTQAVENIPVKFDQGTETLTCTSNFTYNSHGDLATWTYNGGVYKNKGNSWRVDDMKFTISYEYVYDEKGNWTQATVTFPANIDDIPALRTYYKAFKNGFTSNQDRSSAVKPGETPSLTISRSIDYWDEKTVASEKENKKNKESAVMGHLRYKGTDIYGLFGKVKSVKIHEESYEFDQVGNLVAMQDEFGDRATYQYVTAASYKVEGWEDHLVSIESKDGLRTDICPDANTNAELDQIYTFDKSNRITSHKFSSHMAYITRIYTYVGDSKYPATMVQKHPEDGTATYRYTYTKFDKHKNWTERKVCCTIEYDDYDENMNYIGKKQTFPKEYIENRTVEYW